MPEICQKYGSQKYARIMPEYARIMPEYARIMMVLVDLHFAFLVLFSGFLGFVSRASGLLGFVSCFLCFCFFHLLKLPLDFVENVYFVIIIFWF